MTDDELFDVRLALVIAPHLQIEYDYFATAMCVRNKSDKPDRRGGASDTITIYGNFTFQTMSPTQPLELPKPVWHDRLTLEDFRKKYGLPDWMPDPIHRLSRSVFVHYEPPLASYFAPLTRHFSVYMNIDGTITFQRQSYTLEIDAKPSQITKNQLIQISEFLAASGYFARCDRFSIDKAFVVRFPKSTTRYEFDTSGSLVRETQEVPTEFYRKAQIDPYKKTGFCGGLYDEHNYYEDVAPAFIAYADESSQLL